MIDTLALCEIDGNGPFSAEIAVYHLFYTGYSRTNACRMRGRAVRSGCVAGSAGKRLPALRNGCPTPYISREILRGSRGDLANASRRPFPRAQPPQNLLARWFAMGWARGRHASPLFGRLAPKRPPRAVGRWARIELGCAISRADSCVAQRLGHGRCGA